MHQRCSPTYLAHSIILAAIATPLIAAPATITVNLHAGPGEPALLDAAGALIAAGAEVRAGWFEPGFDVATDGWNPAAVGATFHEFGRTNVRPVFDQQGRFAAAVSGDGTDLAGRSIALWIIATSGDELAGPYSNATAHALVMSTAANWVFPDSAAIPPDNATTLALGEADTVILGVSGAGGGGLDVQLAGTGRDYELWRAQTFTAGAPLSDSGDDADGDGLTNTVEFFAGTDPLVANQPPVSVGVETEAGQRWLVLTIDRSPWARGVNAEVESSSDQVAWTLVTDVQLAGDGAAQLQQSGRVPAPDTAAGERRYIRAVVRTTVE